MRTSDQRNDSSAADLGGPATAMPRSTSSQIAEGIGRLAGSSSGIARQADSRYRFAIIIVLGAVATAGYLYYGQPNVAEPPTPTQAAAPDAGTITVHVSGAVARPGLVEIPWSGRVADAIAAAGGSMPTADLTTLNLAASLRDGEQVVVPQVSRASISGTSHPSDGRVRLNAASATELEAIPGVGPVLAGRIVAVREERGGFTTLEDLLDVAGIGEAKLAAMRDLVVVP